MCCRGVILFTRYHPDSRTVFPARLHWACIGAIRHGLNVLAHACSRAIFPRAAPPLHTTRGSLWTRSRDTLPFLASTAYHTIFHRKCQGEFVRPGKILREDAFESKAPSRTLPKTGWECFKNRFIAIPQHPPKMQEVLRMRPKRFRK